MKRKSPLFLLGPAGSFSDTAADRFKKSFRKKYCSSFREVFQKMKHGGYGFLPVKNKIFGELRFVTRELKSQRKKYEVISHIRFPVRLVLAAQKKMALADFRLLYLSMLIRKQCEKFLKKYFKHAKKITSDESSSSMIKKVAQLKWKMASRSAGIGSEKAAKLFGLKILKRNIQDDPRDWTRFVLFRAR